MIDHELVITIPGIAAPKGSLKCVGTKGRHRLIEDNPKTAVWRASVVTHLLRALVDEHADPHQAIGVEVTSTFPRPASHYGTGRNAHVVRPSAPTYPSTAYSTGDVDKLARLVLDALADAHVLDNDAQVVEVTSRKAYIDDRVTPDALDHPGARIRIFPFEVPL